MELGNDDGLFLLFSWQAANGFGLDTTIPQAPSYLVNSFLMLLGVERIIDFRWINLALVTFSSLLFFWVLGRGQRATPFIPIAVTMSMLAIFLPVIGSGGSGMNFFMLGAAAMMLGLDRAEWGRTILLAVAGGLLGLAGFMHAALVLAMLLWILAAMLLRPQLRRSPLLPAFLMASLLLWGSYLYCLGPSNLLSTPAGHDASIGYLLSRFGMHARFYAEAAAVIAVTLLLLANPLVRRADLAIVVPCALVTAFYALGFADYLLKVEFGAGQPTPRLSLPWHGEYFLSAEGLWASRIVGALSFFVLTFAFLFWVVAPLTQSKGERSVVGIIQARFASDEQVNLLLAALGVAFVQGAVGVGSNTSISQGMVAYAGQACGLAVLLWASALRWSGVVRPPALMPMALSWVGLFLIFALFYNHPQNESIFARMAPMRGVPVMEGIQKSEEFQSSLVRILDAYEENGCRSKMMLSLDYTPTLFYIAKHPTPDGIGVPRALYYFPEEKIMDALEKAGEWCVLDVTTVETDGAIRFGNWQDRREAVRSWVKSRSGARVGLPVEGIPDLVSATMFVAGKTAAALPAPADRTN